MYERMIESVKEEIREVESDLLYGQHSEDSRRELAIKLFEFNCLLRELTQGETK